jgi:hypothetical protein
MSAVRPALAGQALVTTGRLAARVLSDHFARVTIVDRDGFPPQQAPRKGVPQAQHIHVLLTRGARLLEGLFPGVLDELVAVGPVSPGGGRRRAVAQPAPRRDPGAGLGL